MKTVLSVQHYPTFGGPHQEIITVREELARLGYRTVVAITDEPGTAADILAREVETHRIALRRLRKARWDESFLALVRLLPDVLRLRRLIRRVRPDVVKVHGPHNPQGALAALAEGVPIVWVLSTSAVPRALRSLGTLMLDRLASSVLVNGPSLLDQYPHARSRLGAKSVVFFPPVDGGRFCRADAEARESVRAALGWPGDSLVVGTVANVNWVKGIDHFIRASALVWSKDPATRFVVVGAEHPSQAPYVENCRRLARESGLLDSGVLRFLGFQPKPERWLRGFDVKVISSVAASSEGTTTTAGEAFACGVPVVASMTGSVPDVVRHRLTGLLVRPEDPAEIAAAVLEILSNPTLRDDLITTAEAFYWRWLTPEATARALVDAFKMAEGAAR